MSKRRIGFPREVLLVEIERHCSDPRCNALTRVGLTKEEARTYSGYECERCERWNDDTLRENDIPDWWEELTITALDPTQHHRAAHTAAEPGEVVTRMSEAWRRTREAANDVEDESKEDQP